MCSFTPNASPITLALQPGIHYPQLQMQAGTTGINAMRVYSVTKQGLDQDKKGKFIKKYVPELKNVPLPWLHEPWKMPCSVQRECGVVIGLDGSYPKPIVDEKASANTAKDRVSAVKKPKKQGSTRQHAQQVVAKHGSRSQMGRADFGGAATLGDTSTSTPSSSAAGTKRKATTATAPATKSPKSGIAGGTGQPSITAMFSTAPAASHGTNSGSGPLPQPLTSSSAPVVAAVGAAAAPETTLVASSASICADASPSPTSTWHCMTCTYINTKPHALVCDVCLTTRR